MIELEHVSKRFGSTLAVDDLSFQVRPGVVTGFLGPNGAGKSTTMRMILGLDAPTSGSVRVNGKPYAQHRRPLHEVGALLEAKAVHTGRSARDHLRVLAATTGIATTRVDEVLEMVGLTDVAKRRVGAFSLGMGQRLGIAAALLGDPQTLILDEPVNGLDPDGIRWIRTLLRELAAEGRTVFLSSHLMSEMAQTADHLIVVGRGRLLREQSTHDFVAGAGRASVRVRTPQGDALVVRLREAGFEVTGTVDAESGQHVLQVAGASTDDVGRLAADVGATLLELSQDAPSLEEAFMELTADSREYVDRRDPVGATS